jgi:hypothetical protein
VVVKVADDYLFEPGSDVVIHGKIRFRVAAQSGFVNVNVEHADGRKAIILVPAWAGQAVTLAEVPPDEAECQLRYLTLRARIEALAAECAYYVKQDADPPDCGECAAYKYVARRLREALEGK